MHFEGRRKTGTTLNMTPLIDVVFLLLVFFMLTSHFIRDEVIDLDLPTAKSGATLEGELLQVVLDDHGRILLAGEEIALSGLESRLRHELMARSEKRVRIRGDKVASLEMTVNVLDAARRAGADGVDIVTREK